MEMEVLAELIECSVCLDRMDNKSKVLPCQHTFCQDCLTRIAAHNKGEVRCPECRSLCTISVKNLPANILLVRLLEGLKSAGKPIPTKQQVYKASGRPCAKAMYSYDPREPGDLQFRRGELIYLKRKIDDNWFIGELNGRTGNLPSTFVQVICPLPDKPVITKRTESSISRGVSRQSSSDDVFPRRSSDDSSRRLSDETRRDESALRQAPTVTALYDFTMRQEDDKEDCLKFNKDDVIQVLRRVDENWAEGRIGAQIGIFPLSYVMITESARLLLDQKPKNKIMSKIRPRSAQVLSTRSSSPTDPTDQLRRRAPPSRHQVESSPLRSRTTSEATSSYLTKTDITHSNSTHNASTCVTDYVNIKSLTQSQHSQSAESLLSIGQNQPINSPGTSNQPISSAVSLPSSLSNSSPSQNLYRALYNYKPTEEDELALIRGVSYQVIEKCKDGWYRGRCTITGARGVFPGNYVQLEKQSDQMEAAQSSDSVEKGESAQQSGQRNVKVGNSSREDLLLPTNSHIENRAVTNTTMSSISLTVKSAESKKSSPLDVLRMLNGDRKSRGKSGSDKRRSSSLSRLEIHSTKTTVPAPLSKPTRKSESSKSTKLSNKMRFRCVTAYPAQRDGELSLNVGDIVTVLKKKSEGWYKGTNDTTGRSGIFPACFVQSLPSDKN